MKALIRAIICMLLGLFATGCATGRIADLRDAGSISGGVGPGIGVQARLGAVTHLSLGVMSANKHYGFENRYLAGHWREEEFYWPTALIGAAFLDESTHEPVASLGTTYLRVCEDDKMINPPPYRSGRLLNFKNHDNPEPTFIKHATDFEVGASIVWFSFRIRANPIEMLDFVLGFVGLDISRDDDRKLTTSSTIRDKPRR